jgi:hypothetical protein
VVDELTGLVEQVRRTEGKVVEMSALSSLFATHVNQQAAQIERLYTQASTHVCVLLAASSTARHVIHCSPRHPLLDTSSTARHVIHCSPRHPLLATSSTARHVTASGLGAR